MNFSIFNHNLNNNTAVVNKNSKINYIYKNNNRIAPVSGYRKGLVCSCNKGTVTRVYKDTYTNCAFCERPRTAKPLIRSGMQPKKNPDGSLVNYSYSYREYMRNKKNITYERKLPNTLKNTNQNIYSTNGGNCSNNKCQNETTWKPNNKNFSKQGSVDSSLRLQRLKHQTITGETNCSTGNNCNGTYFAGKPRFTGFIYKKINSNGSVHKEVNCPQNNAIGKARGQHTKNC